MADAVLEGVHFHTFATALGWCGVAWCGPQLRGVQIGHEARQAVADGWHPDKLCRGEDASSLAECDAAGLPACVRDVVERIQRYAAGARTEFDDVPVDLGGLSDFQQRVLTACRRIAWGQHRSYGELARQLGQPRAARAVGAALARNPLPVIIPCHRVVAAGEGKWGGFSAPGGIALKRRMLALESGVGDSSVAAAAMFPA